MTRSLLVTLSVLGLNLAAFAAPAAAAETAGDDATGITRTVDRQAAPKLPAVGVMADVGLPDGVGGSLVVPPAKLAARPRRRQRTT